VNGRVEAVRIVTGGPQSGGPVWWLGALVAFGAAVLILGMVAWVRWRCRRDPLETAFASLGRGAGLSRAQRDEVRRLAARSGVPAAVLLVSESASRDAARGG
jgi:hypothetical protein